MKREAYRKAAWILGDRTIRIVAAPASEDLRAPTFAVRSLADFRRPKPGREGPWQALRTAHLAVRWRDDGRPFDSRNLRIEWRHKGKTRCWKPGDIDEGMLPGIPLSHDSLRHDFIPMRRRAYDPMAGIESYGHASHWPQGRLAGMVAELLGSKGLTKSVWAETRRLWHDEPPCHFKRWPARLLAERERLATIPPGFLSRSGCTILRDDTVPWVEAGNRPDATAAPRAQTLYAFAYGDDFKRGLALMREVFGAAPAIPDWVLGTWFSCYRRMGEAAFRKLKADFDKHDLPLDAIVIDTDWHRQWWAGFDWNHRLFPNPKRFAKWRRRAGLYTAFNVHPCLIPARDSRLEEFLRRSGAPRRIETKATTGDRFQVGCQVVDLFDPRQADAWFDVFHPPIEREGCDVWWVDGQLVHPRGNDCAAVMNEMYYTRTHRGRRDKSPILARASGLGAHRSTILFTGDTHSQWEVLAEEVRTTQRAANKLWACVSHDIGGFFRAPGQDWPNKPPADLFVRWTQFGALSPIMRFHSDHGIREPWRFGREPLAIIRRFLWLRRCLLPYLRALAKEARETGVGLVRPMYYDFPGLDDAYEAESQYMLGGALLVSPVTEPSSRVRTWIPPGRWHHVALQRALQGPAWIEETVPPAICPAYVREGSAIPAYRRADFTGRHRRAPRAFMPGHNGPLLAWMGLE